MQLNCELELLYVILIKLNLLFCSCLFWVIIIFRLQVCNTITIKTTGLWHHNFIETLCNVFLDNEVETLQVGLPIIKPQANLSDLWRAKNIRIEFVHTIK